MAYSFYTVLWVFLIYAFLGWCAEVAFATVKTRSFVNRGFLNGPYCPIYGFGMVIVALCLTPIEDSIVLLFLGSAVLTSLLEFVTGYVLERFFGDKWWDYSKMPLNIRGYICLPFSILWGVACVIIMRVIHPLVLKFIGLLDNRFGIVLTVILSALFLADAAMTVSTLLRLKKQLRLITEINEHMREFSDKLGEGIYQSTLTAMDASEKAKAGINEAKASLDEAKQKEKAELAQKKKRWEAEEKRIKEEIAASEKKSRGELEKFLSGRGFGERRLLKAFPAYRGGSRQEALDRLNELWNSFEARKKAQKEKNKRNKQNKQNQ